MPHERNVNVFVVIFKEKKNPVKFCTISGLKDAVTKKVKITGLSSAFMGHFRVFCFVFLFLCLQNFNFGSSSQRSEAVPE